MKSIIRNKFIELLDKIPLAKNLARKKFISSFILGLIDSRKVQFNEIAIHIESTAKLESVERNIQSFFKDYDFDYQQVCLLLLMFLPKGKLSLSIDRTEWDFGEYQCNILMIVAKSGSIGIPLYWELLDNNSGNSCCPDRCHLLEKLIQVIGKERIGAIVGDREFIGLQWVKYLKDNKIHFCMRIPKSHLITLKNDESYTISELLEKKTERYFQDCLVDGIWCNVMLKKLPDNEFLFLMGSIPAKQLGSFYRRRWCIEVLFQTFKERGFDLESTHLKCSKKLSKLLVFVSIAVALCVKVGEYYHGKVQRIKIKKHGYKANSFFRKGLDIVRRGLKNTTKEFLQLWQECVSIFIRWTDYKFLIINILQKYSGRVQFWIIFCILYFLTVSPSKVNTATLFNILASNKITLLK
ncbi:MAG: IS4 family transposase [Runella sp.]